MTHGDSGPLNVSWGGVLPKVSQAFLDLAAKYDKDRKHVVDANDMFSVNVYAVSLARHAHPHGESLLLTL